LPHETHLWDLTTTEAQVFLQVRGREQGLGQRLVLFGHEGAIVSVAVSLDGKCSDKPLAVNELHDDERRASGFVDLVDDRDVRMLERGRRLCFRKMRAHMYETCEEILHTLGAEIVPIDREANDVPGSAIHEHATCRMGKDERTSVLNSFNQMHEVKNLFVVDGSAFTAASEKNPTLTILALSWWATDYLAEEMRTGRL